MQPNERRFEEETTGRLRSRNERRETYAVGDLFFPTVKQEIRVPVTRRAKRRDNDSWNSNTLSSRSQNKSRETQQDAEEYRSIGNTGEGRECSNRMELYDFLSSPDLTASRVQEAAVFP